MMLFSKLKSLFICLNNFLELSKLLQKPLYRIEEFDTCTGKVVIHCRGSRTHIKTTIEGAILTPNLVEGLPPMQACWLGYHYANPQKENKTKVQKQEPLGFKLQTKKGRFKIMSLDLRNAILTYHDLKTNRVYKEKVTHVAQDVFVINNIDPTQACYIGMQAGFYVSEYGPQSLSKENTTPVFKIV